MTDTPPGLQIAGGAGPVETAAILAVINHLSSEEAAAAANPERRPKQSAWVLAWRPRHTVSPLPSHTYQATPWADVEPAEEIVTDGSQ